MAADQRRPATPDDVLNAIEALTASNAELRDEVRRLEAAVSRLAVSPSPVTPPPSRPEPPRTASVQSPRSSAPVPHVPSGMVPPPGQARPMVPPYVPPASAPRPPQPPAAAATRRQIPAITGAMVIGAVGAAVLLSGVVMLLVLAAQHGYFGPLARVIACGALAVALVIVALLIRRRQHDNVGALVLAGSGIAAGYLDITAMTWLLHVPVRPAMVGAGLLTLAGLALGWWWGAELLAVVATVGALILVPFVSGGDLLTATAFLVLLTVVSTPASWRDRWFVLLGCRVLPTAVYLSVLTPLVGSDDPRIGLLRAAAAVCAAVPFLDWWLLRPVGRRLVRAGGAEPAAATVRAHALTLLPMSVPLWLVAITAPGGWAAVLAVPLLAVAVAHWLVADEPVMVAGSTVVAALAAVAIPVAALDGTPVHICVALICLALLAIHRRTGQIASLVVGAGFAVVCLADALFWLRARSLLYRMLGDALYKGAGSAGMAALTGLLEVSAVVAALLSIGDLAAVRTPRPDKASATRSGWTVAAVAAGCLLLEGPVTAATSAVMILVGLSGVGGVVVGRGLTTLCAAVIVTALMMRSRGPGRDAAIRRAGGYVMMGLILVKLCFYDLRVLDGVVRVIAFIGVGLLMLVLATAYSRTIRPTAPTPPVPTPTAPTPHGGIGRGTVGTRPPMHPGARPPAPRAGEEPPRRYH